MKAKVIAAVVVLAVAGAAAIFMAKRASHADIGDADLVALGQRTYSTHCASCHGAKLEGQANWQERKADGKLPAPPHDASGHTWHHPDRQLFDITKRGVSAIVPGYRSDMPAYGDILSDREIWAVLAYMKSTWPPEVRARQPR